MLISCTSCKSRCALASTGSLELFQIFTLCGVFLCSTKNLPGLPSGFVGSTGAPSGLTGSSDGVPSGLTGLFELPLVTWIVEKRSDFQKRSYFLEHRWNIVVSIESHDVSFLQTERRVSGVLKH